MEKRQPQNDSEPNYIASLPKRGLYLVAATGAMVAWIVMVGRILSDEHPIFDLASHLSWHTWVALSALLIVSCLGMSIHRDEHRLHWWHRCIMGLPPWVYFTWVTQPWTVLPIAINDVEAKGLKIMAWNVWVSNRTPDQVLNLIRENNADVVAIIELGHEQAKVLQQLNNEYPNRLWLPDASSRGIAMLSRIPETQFREIDLGDQGMPAIEADIPAGQNHKGFRVLAVHTRSPDLHSRTLDRNQQLMGLSHWAKSSSKQGVIVGDLNITPWSPPFARLLSEGNVEDSRNYRGHFASWPTILGHFAIPIDHALVTRGSQVLFRSVGTTATDSDHRPITIIVK